MAKSKKASLKPEVLVKNSKLFERVLEITTRENVVEIVLEYNKFDKTFLELLYQQIEAWGLQKSLQMSKGAFYTSAFKTKKELSEREHSAWSKVILQVLDQPVDYPVFIDLILNAFAHSFGYESSELWDVPTRLTQVSDNITWLGAFDIKEFNSRYYALVSGVNNNDEQLMEFAKFMYKNIQVYLNFFNMYDPTRSLFEGLYKLLNDKIESSFKINELNKKLETQEKEYTQKLKEITKQNQDSKNEEFNNLIIEIDELKSEKELLTTEKQDYLETINALRKSGDNSVDYGEYNKLNDKYLAELEKNSKLVKRLEAIEEASSKEVIKEANKVNPVISNEFNEDLFINGFVNESMKNGLFFDEDDLINFHMAVKSSPLTIIAGASGMGKTQLPLAYAKCINASEANGNLLFMPISPSYTEPSDVLGFFNVNKDEYIPSETGLVDLLIHANEHRNQMHMIIFDEMNLSQIEYWFAPFMSVLEKPTNERFLTLYSKKLYESLAEDKRCYPYQVELTDNIIFVGTINLDETTKDMSDRLIDRAIVINLKKKNFVDCMTSDVAYMKLYEEYCLCNTYDEFDSMRLSLKSDYINNLSKEENEFFDSLHNDLQEKNPSKGVSFRNRRKIAAYLSVMPVGMDRKEAFDLIFKQTILKKINGYGESISNILGKLKEDGTIEKSVLNDVLNKYSNVSDFKLTRLELKNKIKEFKDYGFTK